MLTPRHKLWISGNKVSTKAYLKIILCKVWIIEHWVIKEHNVITFHAILLLISHKYINVFQGVSIVRVSEYAVVSEIATTSLCKAEWSRS